MIAGRIHHEEHEGHEEYSFVPSWLSSLLLQGVALTKPPSIRLSLAAGAREGFLRGTSLVENRP